MRRIALRLMRPTISVPIHAHFSAEGATLFRPTSYLIACGLIGDPTARVIGNGGPQKKNS